MNKKIKKCSLLLGLFSAVTFALGLCACGETEPNPDKKPDEKPEPEVVSKLAFTLSEDGTYYTLTGIGTETDTTVVVPETYQGKPVTKVAAGALKDQTQIKDLTIPSCVTSIGFGAFEGCAGLESLSFPYVWEEPQWDLKGDNGKEYKGVHFTYFFGGTTENAVIFLNGSSEALEIVPKLVDNYIPAGLKTIALSGKLICRSAFLFCNIDYIFLGEEIEEVQMMAFSGCAKEVDFAKLPQTIERDAFDLGKKVDNDIFPKPDPDIIINIPDLDSWFSAGCWRSYIFSGSPFMPDYILTVNHKPITNVVISKEITYLDSYMFDGMAIQKIFYCGTQEEHASIEVLYHIGGSSNVFSDAVWYYYSETKPTGEGHYWHYADDGVTVVEW